MGNMSGAAMVEQTHPTLGVRLHHICCIGAGYVGGPTCATIAHALVVLTEWDEFKQYPYEEFYAKMMKPAFLFDGRSILDHTKLEDIGFEVHAIGKGRGPDGRLRALSKLPTM